MTAKLPRELERLLHPERLARGEAGMELGRRGFETPLRAFADVRSLAGGGPECEAFGRIFAPLLEACAASPDPDMALANWERFARARADAGTAGRSAVYARLAAVPGAIRVLTRVFAASQAFTETLMRYSEAFDALAGGGALARPRAREDLVPALARALAPCADEGARRAALRRFRRVETVRIGARDLALDAPVEEVTRELSDLADTLVSAALSIAAEKLRERFGEPCADSGEPAVLCVLAMGKLGGRELNYASDIDLVLLYSEDGATAGGARSVPNADYFARLANEIVSILAEPTEEGRVYRVDTRLRPDGAAGAPVRSLAATESYYRRSGRTWERQALVKARPCAGDLALGEALLATLNDFIYPPFLSHAAVRELQESKRRAGARESGGVKFGPGGLRDVEFTVQFLQLAHGGRDASVRGANTLEAIERLARAGALAADEAAHLAKAYRFLRAVEHRLMTMNELQLFEMPHAEAERGRLARRLGFVGSVAEACAALDTRYARLAARTRATCEAIWGRRLADADDELAPVMDAIRSRTPSPEAAAALAGRGFRDGERAARALLSLAGGGPGGPGEAEAALAQIAPGLLARLAEAPDADAALAGIERMLAPRADRGALFARLAGDAGAQERLVRAAGAPLLVELVAANPASIEAVLRPAGRAPEAVSLSASARRTARADADAAMRTLRSLRDAELAHVAAADLAGELSIEARQRALSYLADAVLTTAFEIAWREAVDRLGRVRAERPRPRGAPGGGRYAVAALGRLGSREMGYASDLDLVVFSEDAGRTDAGHAAAEVYARMAQEAARRLGEAGGTGALYEVDYRLRPAGASGALVTTLDGFERYAERGEIALWERMALTRSRVVCGAESLRDEVTALLRRVTYAPADANEVAREARRMRAKLEKAADRASPAAGSGDLKRGPGGLMDVEFAVEATLLARGAADAGVRLGHTRAALRALGKAGYLEEMDAAALLEAYDFLHALEGRLRLFAPGAGDRLPEEPAARAAFARFAGWPDADTLAADVETHTREARAAFERVMGA